MFSLPCYLAYGIVIASVIALSAVLFATLELDGGMFAAIAVGVPLSPCATLSAATCACTATSAVSSSAMYAKSASVNC